MIEITDVVFDRDSGNEAIVISIFKQEENNKYLLGFKDGTFGEGLDNNLCYAFFEDDVIFRRKPNRDDIKLFIDFRYFLHMRDLEKYDNKEYTLDNLIDNIKYYYNGV